MPLDLEYESISASMVPEVAASAVRPLGPAATEPSEPSLILFLSIASAPFLFITSITKSVASPPNWNPTLKPTRRYIAGALHGPSKFAPVRHDIAPRP